MQEDDVTTDNEIGAAIRLALDDAEAQGRLLLTQDPTLRRLTHCRPEARDSPVPEPVGWWPVALVEPLYYRALRINDTIYLLTEQIAGKLGLARAQLGSAPSAVANWSFRQTGPQCELLDPTGTTLAGFRHPADPLWHNTAEARGEVLVLYGGKLGVRKPGGLAAASYDDRARDTELHLSLASGTVLAASIRYLQK